MDHCGACGCVYWWFHPQRSFVCPVSCLFECVPQAKLSHHPQVCTCLPVHAFPQIAHNRLHQTCCAVLSAQKSDPCVQPDMFGAVTARTARKPNRASKAWPGSGRSHLRTRGTGGTQGLYTQVVEQLRVLICCHHGPGATSAQRTVSTPRDSLSLFSTVRLGPGWACLAHWTRIQHLASGAFNPNRASSERCTAVVRHGAACVASVCAPTRLLWEPWARGCQWSAGEAGVTCAVGLHDTTQECLSSVSWRPKAAARDLWFSRRRKRSAPNSELFPLSCVSR